MTTLLRKLINENIKKLLLTEEFYHGSPYAFDKFDINKVGTGDGLSKYGYGLYFTDNPQAAAYYARELSKGKLKTTGLNLYTVQIYNLDRFAGWEEPIPDNIFSRVVHKLIKVGKEDDAQELQNESSYENGYDMWSIRSLYEWLTVILGSQKETTDFLSICGLEGVKAEDAMLGGSIYACYDDSNVKILDTEKLNG